MVNSVDRIAGVNDGLAAKAPVRVATTSNITLSGEQTIDGIAVVDGNRVLVKSQTDAEDNGIYVASTGNWARAKDFDGSRDVVKGTQVYVNSGTVNGAAVFRVTTSDPIVIGTTELSFSSIVYNPADYIVGDNSTNNDSLFDALALARPGQFVDGRGLTYYSPAGIPTGIQLYNANIRTASEYIPLPLRPLAHPLEGELVVVDEGSGKTHFWPGPVAQVPNSSDDMILRTYVESYRHTQSIGSPIIGIRSSDGTKTGYRRVLYSDDTKEPRGLVGGIISGTTFGVAFIETNEEGSSTGMYCITSSDEFATITKETISSDSNDWFYPHPRAYADSDGNFYVFGWQANRYAYVAKRAPIGTGTYSQSTTTSTITLTAHGLTTGDSVNLTYTSGSATSKTYTVTVTDANTFTVTDPVSQTTSGAVTVSQWSVTQVKDWGATGQVAECSVVMMPDESGWIWYFRDDDGSQAELYTFTSSFDFSTTTAFKLSGVTNGLNPPLAFAEWGRVWWYTSARRGTGVDIYEDKLLVSSDEITGVYANGGAAVNPVVYSVAATFGDNSIGYFDACKLARGRWVAYGVDNETANGADFPQKTRMIKLGGYPTAVASPFLISQRRIRPPVTRNSTFWRWSKADSMTISAGSSGRIADGWFLGGSGADIDVTKTAVLGSAFDNMQRVLPFSPQYAANFASGSGGSGRFLDQSLYGYDEIARLADSVVTFNLLASGTYPATSTALRCYTFINSGTSPGVSTYARSGNTITVTQANHHIKTGQQVYLDIKTGTATSGLYTATYATSSTFTVTDAASGTTSGNVEIDYLQMESYFLPQYNSTQYLADGLMVFSVTTRTPPMPAITWGTDPYIKFRWLINDTGTLDLNVYAAWVDLADGYIPLDPVDFVDDGRRLDRIIQKLSWGAEEIIATGRAESTSVFSGLINFRNEFETVPTGITFLDSTDATDILVSGSTAGASATFERISKRGAHLELTMSGTPLTANVPYWCSTAASTGALSLLVETGR